MNRARFGRCALASLLIARGAAAEPEPWSDPDGLGEPVRHEFGETGVSAGAEYRANWLYVNPITLNAERLRKLSVAEHRMRVDFAVDHLEKLRVVTSLDFIDGAVWGDNGVYGGNPSKNGGTRVAATWPNASRLSVGYLGEGDDLDPNAYGYVYEPAPFVEVRRLYGEVTTGVGVFRIGRQPTTDGTALLVASGDGRANRFGYSGDGDTTDRILFATKPLEGLKPDAERDRSRDRGLFLIGFYDWAVNDSVHLFGDNLQGSGSAVRYLLPMPERRSHLELQGNYAHRWEGVYDTNVNIFGLRAMARFDRLRLGAEGAWVYGGTREVSEALALVNNDPIVRQTIDQWGARAVARWDEPSWTAYLEFDFASSDRNPNPGSDLTMFKFAEDANVGLLMFERVLQYASWRSSAAGVTLLRRLGAVTFPNETVNTRGVFTNALALFPQFDVRPAENLLFRAGVLAAWAPIGLVDPNESLQNRDGIEYEDDLVNFNEGRPGNFYGVELDGRISYTYLEHFIFDFESAILFPGDAFQDENGRAARSVLFQGRTTWVF
ncbi:MAG: hypothetical protein IT376_17805 [Polyangiaceae bacterium]|nr:hypothetical protein [Polyangiaceae bacterium]